MIVIIVLALTLAFYFLMIKPKHCEKAKAQRKSGKVIEFTLPEPDRNNRSDGPNYDNIINDFPTYQRNK